MSDPLANTHGAGVGASGCAAIGACPALPPAGRPRRGRPRPGRGEGDGLQARREPVRAPGGVPRRDDAVCRGLPHVDALHTPGALSGGQLRHGACPGLGVWRKSRVGVAGFAYRQRVVDLAQGSAYRAVVHYRWYSSDRQAAAQREPDLVHLPPAPAAQPAGGEHPRHPGGGLARHRPLRGAREQHRAAPAPRGWR